MNFIEIHPWISTGMIFSAYALVLVAVSAYKRKKRKWGENH